MYSIAYHLDHDPNTYGIQEEADRIDLSASLVRLIGDINAAVAAAYPSAEINAVLHRTVGWRPPITVYASGRRDFAAERDIEDIVESVIAQYNRWVVASQ